MKRKIQKAVRCPFLGRPTFIKGEVFYGLSCVQCDYYNGSTRRSVECFFEVKTCEDWEAMKQERKDMEKIKVLTEQ